MLRVMIIGCGMIAPKHINGFLAYGSDCKITVLANRNVAKAEALKNQFNLDCICVSDYKDGLKHCDAVVICTPPASHKQMAIDAFESGKHVLCEKPLAQSLEDCDLMIESAKKHGKVFSSIAQNRFIPENAKVINMIKNGDLGKVFHTSVQSYWFRTDKYYDMDWRGKWEIEGGGVTMNNAIHHMDLLLWAGGMPSEITSTFSNLNHKGSNEEDISISIFKYPNGSLATVTCSMLHHGEEKEIYFQAEKGGVSIPFKARCSKGRADGFGVEDEEGKLKIEEIYKSKVYDKPERFDGQIANFLDAILKGDNLLISGEDGKNALELVVAIYKSSITGKPVILPLAKDDKYYTLLGRTEDAPRFNS
ncbi:MAG: Gfo/Idh/MocA family oxidoreductase [Bacillota bacterium]